MLFPPASDPTITYAPDELKTTTFHSTPTRRPFRPHRRKGMTGRELRARPGYLALLLGITACMAWLVTTGLQREETLLAIQKPHAAADDGARKAARDVLDIHGRPLRLKSWGDRAIGLPHPLVASPRGKVELDHSS